MKAYSHTQETSAANKSSQTTLKLQTLSAPEVSTSDLPRALPGSPQLEAPRIYPLLQPHVPAEDPDK